MKASRIKTDEVGSIFREIDTKTNKAELVCTANGICSRMNFIKWFLVVSHTTPNL